MGGVCMVGRRLSGARRALQATREGCGALRPGGEPVALLQAFKVAAQSSQVDAGRESTDVVEVTLCGATAVFLWLHGL